MKKLIVLIIVLLASVNICLSADILLTEQDVVYEISVSDVVVVELESNPSTGYYWQINSNNLTVLNRKFIADNPDNFGSSGIDHIELVSTNESMGVLELTLNGRGQDVETLRYIIKTQGVSVVQNNNNLTSGRKRNLTALYTDTSLPERYMVCSGVRGLDKIVTSDVTCPIVKNQGNCGSCWAFATVGMFEIKIAVEQNISVDLSEQFLISCNDYGYDCNGGKFDAHDFHMNRTVMNDYSAGAVYEHEDPYTQSIGLCDTPYQKAATLLGWEFVKSSDPDYPNWPTPTDIKKAMLKHGPIGVGVCTDSTWSNAVEGNIYQHNPGCNTVNHAVVLVGWVDRPDFEEGGYWILRNSWGPYWCNRGYMLITYDANMVGTDANFINYGSDIPDSNPIPDNDDNDNDDSGGSGGSGCFISIIK